MIMVDKDGDGTFRATSSPVKNMTAAVNAIEGSSGHSHRSSPYSILYCKPLLSGTYRTTVGSVLCMSYGLWRRPTSAKHPLCGSIDSACGRLEPAPLISVCGALGTFRVSVQSHSNTDNM